MITTGAVDGRSKSLNSRPSLEAGADRRKKLRADNVVANLEMIRSWRRLRSGNHHGQRFTLFRLVLRALAGHSWRG